MRRISFDSVYENFKSPRRLTIILCILIWGLSSGFAKEQFIMDKPLGTALIFIVFFVFFISRYKSSGQGLSEEQLVLFVVVGGILVRMIYIWSTPYNISPHDLGPIQNDSQITSGHLGYIGYFLNYQRFPDFDPRSVWTFSSPPLYHIISALWLFINLLIGLPWNIAVDNLRVITLLFSSLCVVELIDIFDLMNIKGRPKTTLAVLASFFPSFIWLSGTLTSDSLALLFMLMTFKYTILWYRQRKLSQIIFLAFSIGFGMLTKMNCVLMAAGTALLFVFAFVSAIRAGSGEYKKYIKQFIVFGLICIPIGMFWAVRCNILYDIPFNYVQRLSEQNTQFIGSASVWQRIGIPSLEQLSYAKIKFDAALDTNIFLTMSRSAMFDEQNVLNFTSDVGTFLGQILLYVSILLSISMNGCLLYELFNKNSLMKKEYKWYVSVLYIVILASFISFCFEYTHICSMSFRYVAILPLFPCVGAGLFMMGSKRSKIWEKSFSVAISVLSILSVLIYLRYCVSL